jgi:hypothetical protein
MRVGGNTFSKPCQGVVDFSPLSQVSAVLLTRQQPSSEAFDGEPAGSRRGLLELFT